MTIRAATGAIAVLAALAVVPLASSSASGSTGTCLPQRAPGGPVTVAVVDTGISRHAGLGPVRDVGPRVDAGPEGSERFEHGTEMASIIHRQAPAAVLVDVPVLDDRGRADPDAVALGIRRAIAAQVDVVNLSLDGVATDDDVLVAIHQATAAGATVVVAAGNEARDLDGHPGWQALTADPGVVVVGAIDDDGAPLPGTAWGHDVIDLVAPGRDVPAVDHDGAPTTATGTSPAAAAVSGAVAAALDQSGPAGACHPLTTVKELAGSSTHGPSGSSRPAALETSPDAPPGDQPRPT